jgi:Ser/Thr protein kinase RdoA (MazF antagonist)
MDAPLTDQVLGSLLSLYDAGDLKHAQRLTTPGARATYKVTTAQAEFVLVVHEDRPFWDLVFEKDLVLFLRERSQMLGGVELVEPVTNVAGGYFFPVQPQRYAWLLRALLGRALGPFEVDEDVCRQVGALLARFHQAAAAFHGNRGHARRETVEHWYAPAAHVEALRDAYALLSLEARWLRGHLNRLLPHATLVGMPGPAAMRFHNGKLCQLVDLTESSRGPMLLDVAQALCLWAFDKDAPVVERCRALLLGYAAVRPLHKVERRMVFPWVRLAAWRLMASHVRDFELRQRADEPLGYRDYQVWMRRLVALRALPRAQVRAWLAPGGDA